ncbi:hypothetical protein ABKN59_006303 [Abortiporus biennis]
MNPILFVLFALFSFTSALPTLIAYKRDVYVPPITSPTQDTIWTIGTQVNVTWDTSNPPAQITNGLGKIVLVTDGLLDYENPIAANFSILDGFHTITVPDVAPKNDYAIVLFGDSGNRSQNFTIQAAPVAAPTST